MQCSKVFSYLGYTDRDGHLLGAAVPEPKPSSDPSESSLHLASVRVAITAVKSARAIAPIRKSQRPSVANLQCVSAPADC
jgi:hypothetical protein